jgi:hypothetical protein
MRPVLSVVFVESMPMNDDRLATAGSWRIARASAQRSPSPQEIVCGASGCP